jgi:hypothetical protein
MKKSITISVTPEDIKLGTKLSCKRCPIARAIKRQVKNGVAAEVSFDMFSLNYNGVVEEGFLPKKATDFVFRFDDGKSVKPFAFRAKVDEKFLKL